jgi:hypothetical protein
MAQLLPSPKTDSTVSCVALDDAELEYHFIYDYFTRDFNCEILQIDKLRNRPVQKKFLTELKLAIEKYKDRSLTQLVKLLFHGSKITKPDAIYTGN